MLTVHELAAMELLRLEIVAGSGGSSRVIRWAHTVELPDPWRWVSPGDLVMTTGVGLPSTAHAQVDWLEQLQQSNASALVIAPRPDAPPLTPQMLEAADRMYFPIIHASFELEFVKLSHLVIESVLQAQRERFNASERLFHTYAEALRREADMGGRLAVLAQTLDLDLAIEDAVSGICIVEARQGNPSASHGLERIPIAGRANANLLIGRRPKGSLDDSILVRSLVGLLGVELEREMIHRDTQRMEGAALLRSLLDNETEFAIARPTLKRKGFDGTLVSLAIKPGAAGPWNASEVHQAPALHLACPLLLEADDLLLALSCDNPAMINNLLDSLGSSTVIGVSGPIATATGLRESLRQARLALAQAQETGALALRYGDIDTGLVMAPKSLPEARALVGRYLGALIEYDRVNNARLLNTLITFLANDGNWKATAIDLEVHRQTLVYRMKLVGQLTGIKATSTEGIARLWIAIQAGRNCGLLEGTDIAKSM
ncbi:PucR family transcriptional regulator [Pseudomonas sp. CC120222-01a]|uniref:PucR family transcriptional regulator n=1 Tax=Pseudomonas sp. CC120222-01a TaxID=1378075 RepID=UPI000D962533|nr:PucR family transcriptional regulator [Pseudomonas sp. CC120222-01a]PVZ41197.1 purine catabolism regulator [Pseudomonas sp. CC120222-01a]